MQNADLLLILGSSLGSSVIGYDPKQFSPKSYKIMVDIDADEYNKNIVHIDEAYNTSLNEFFGAML
jgi:thiamine pyrophosphate-dependent acetolactate synthase large subunit-like protein